MSLYRPKVKPLWLAAALACLGAASPAAQDAPPDTLLLFVAGWCAPCHAELAQIDAIVAAAGDARVRVVPLDDTARTQAMLDRVPDQVVWRPDPAALAKLRERVFGDNAGLPYSVLTDASGRVCARSKRSLDAVRVREMADRCRAAAR